MHCCPLRLFTSSDACLDFLGPSVAIAEEGAVVSLQLVLANVQQCLKAVHQLQANTCTIPTVKSFLTMSS